MRERPGHREPGERQARLLRERAQGVHRRELPLVPVAVLVALGGVPEREAGPRGGPGLAAVLAGEEAAGDRVIGNDADALLQAERQSSRSICRKRRL
jgi:hypothetical protein